MDDFNLDSVVSSVPVLADTRNCSHDRSFPRSYRLVVETSDALC